MIIIRVKELIKKLQSCSESDKVYVKMKDGSQLEVQSIDSLMAGVVVLITY